MKLQQKHVSNINVGKKFRLSKGFYPTQKVNFVTHDTIWHPLFDIKSNELHNKPQQVNCYLCALCHFQSLFFVRVSPCDWHKYSSHRVLSPFPEHFKKKFKKKQQQKILFYTMSNLLLMHSPAFDGSGYFLRLFFVHVP